MLVTNEAPRLEDTSGALANRFVALQLKNSWLGKEDMGLERRLLRELPEIFQWAVEGWRDLQKEGSLLQPDSGRELGEDLKNLGSPTLRFVEDCCVQETGGWTKTEDLYKAWQRWASLNNENARLPSSHFARNLKAACPTLKKTQPRQPDGSRAAGYEGIALINT
jgi:putative DNA primase/helicase